MTCSPTGFVILIFVFVGALGCGPEWDTARFRVVDSELEKGNLKGALGILAEFKPQDAGYATAQKRQKEIEMGMAIFAQLSGVWYYTSQNEVKAIAIQDAQYEQRIEGNTIYRRDWDYAKMVKVFGEARAGRAHPWTPFLRFLSYGGGNSIRVRQFGQAPEEIEIHP